MELLKKFIHTQNSKMIFRLPFQMSDFEIKDIGFFKYTQIFRVKVFNGTLNFN